MFFLLVGLLVRSNIIGIVWVKSGSACFNMQPLCWERQWKSQSLSQSLAQSSHDEPERPGTGVDGGLLPDGSGHRHLGLHEVQASAEQKPGWPDRGDSAGKQGDQPGGGNLHHDRWVFRGQSGVTGALT